MSLMNRLGNAQNPYQGSAKRVLCVCSAGLLRSPTAAVVLAREFGFNTRAVGCVEEYALIPVDEVLLRWAQEIVCMEKTHMETIFANFRNFHDPITVLDIPDTYGYMDTELQDIIFRNYKESVPGKE